MNSYRLSIFHTHSIRISYRFQNRYFSPDSCIDRNGVRIATEKQTNKKTTRTQPARLLARETLPGLENAHKRRAHQHGEQTHPASPTLARTHTHTRDTHTHTHTRHTRTRTHLRIYRPGRDSPVVA